MERNFSPSRLRVILLADKPPPMSVVAKTVSWVGDHIPVKISPDIEPLPSIEMTTLPFADVLLLM
jgi:hypothetical protein